MQIGEFARICQTRISVLRHYDKQGLLVPAYIVRFTGYRYYTEDQIAVFVRISALKRAGFSLTEIREILAQVHKDSELFAQFDKKKAELLGMLRHLEEAQNMMREIKEMLAVTFKETADGLIAQSETAEGNEFNNLCDMC